MYILDFNIHTHTNYLLITPEMENQERLPFIKGSVRVDKASLTQYVNHRISEVKTMKELKQRLLIGVMEIFHCVPEVVTSTAR